MDLDALAADWARAERLPALGVAVVRRGAEARLAHAGADAGPDSVWRIGSVSKAITAIGVMQLVERGTLELGAPVVSALRSLRIAGAGAERITILHLLGHTAGFGVLRRASDLRRPMTGLAGKGPAPPIAEFYGGTVRTEFAPGEAWIYSNHGYAVLGQLVEDVTGTPFADHMRTHILRPLGMHDTDYAPDPRLLTALVQGFERRGERLVPASVRAMLLPPAGSVLSTTRDLARLLTALVAGGGSVVAPETLEQMLRPHYRLHAAMPGMGLGFALDRVGGERVALHNGAWEGFASHLAFAPGAGVGVALVTSVRTTVLDRLAAELLRGLLGVADPRAALRHGPPPDRDARAFAGIYRPLPEVRGRRAMLSGMPGAMEVVARDGRLAIRALPRRSARPLHPAAGDDPLLFWLEREGTVQPAAFGVDGEGHVDRLYLGPHRFARKRREGLLARLRGG